jgi:hypothetical protein
VPSSDAKDVLLKIAATLMAALIAGAARYIYRFLYGLRLSSRLKDDDCTPTEIKNGVLGNRALYIRPDCQDDLSSDVNATTRRPMFRELDRLLGPPKHARFVLILADTGMGKSEFLQRYYAYHWRSGKRRSRFKMIVHPLNGLDVGELLKRFRPQDQSNTVLLLDALDEDRAAADEFADRFNDLVRLAGKFYAVVVTCRTQFLTESAFVPEEVELPGDPGPTPLLTIPLQRVCRLYLSPLSDSQVKSYLARRFPYWLHPMSRVHARYAAKRFKDILSRPLLLTFIQDLASNPEEPRFSFQAYRIIIAAWIKRETHKNQLKIQPAVMLRICEEFAVLLFTTRRDRASANELQYIVDKFGAGPFFRQVRERSLLNEDANGNWKFAHRSIMEYLLANLIGQTGSLPSWGEAPWTDQMRKFACEMLRSGECKRMPRADLRAVDFEAADLSGCDLSGATLCRAILSKCLLFRANLRDANLADSRMESAQLYGAHLNGACLDRAWFYGAHAEAALGLTLQQAAAATADVATSWPIHVFEGHTSAVVAVAFDASGKRAVSGSWDGTARVWELEGNAESRVLKGHTDRVRAVALDGEGKQAVSGSDDNTVRVWTLAGDARPLVLEGHTDSVRAVALDAGGKRALSGSQDGTVRVWELEGNAEPRVLKGHSGAVVAVAFDASGKRAISGSWDGTVRIWELEGDAEPRVLKGHTDRVRAVALDGDGKYAVSGSDDNTVRVWELEGNTKPLVLEGHTDSVRAVALTAEGTCALSGSRDGTVRVWALEGNAAPRVLKGRWGPAAAVAFSADCTRFLSDHGSHGLCLWFPSSGGESSAS